MALTTLITIDKLTNSAVLNVIRGSDQVENITYIDNTLTIDIRHQITITGQEFIDLVAQFNVFQTALYFNYAALFPGLFPFGVSSCIEAYDSGANTRALTSQFNDQIDFVHYVAYGSSVDVILLGRDQPSVISFPEWIYFLVQFNHYRDSVKQFLNI